MATKKKNVKAAPIGEMTKPLKPKISSKEKDAVKWMIEEIESAISPDDFQMKFFRSIQEQFNQFSSLTEKQVEALTRMHNRITD